MMCHKLAGFYQITFVTSLAMKKLDKYFSIIQTWLIKPLRNILCTIALLTMAIVAILHLPAVQQSLLGKTLNYLHSTTKYHITCDTMRLTWLQHIVLRGITVTDPQQKPLFTINECNGSFHLLSLMLLKADMIDSISVSGIQLYLEENSTQDLNIATFYTNVILPYIPATTTDLSIRALQLNDCNLHYYNQRKKQTITVEKIDLHIKNLFSSTHLNAGSITSLTYKATNVLPFELKSFITKFRITSHNILFKECQLLTKHSCLQGDFELRNTKHLDIFSDQENMILEATLNETSLSSIELDQFSDFFKGVDMLYKLDGVISLTPQSMAWKDCKLTFGASNSYFESTGCCNEINKQMVVNILVNNGLCYINDLRPHLPQTLKIDPYLTELPYIGLTNTTLMGNSQKAKLAGHITTPIGAVHTDLILENLSANLQNLTYVGNITLHRVALNALLPMLPITAISAEVSIQGQGGSIQRSTLNATANITELKTATYDYIGIEASCTISNTIMAFNVNSKDPSAKLTIAGNYHFGPKKNLQANGIVAQMHLSKLGLMAFPLEVNTQFSLTLHNILSNFPQGTLIFNQCNIQALEKKIILKQITIGSAQNGEENILTLTSPFMDCRLKGVFTPEGLGSHIKHLMSIRDVADLTNRADQATIPTKFSIHYTINCKKVSALLNWFYTDLYISPETTFLGQLRYDHAYYFSLELPTASTICFKQLSLEKTKIHLTINHLTNHIKRLVRLNFSSEKLNWNKKIQTDHLALQLLIDKNTFTMSNTLSCQPHHSTLSLKCSGTLMQDAIYIDLLPSCLKTHGKIWTIQTEQTSVISKTAIDIGNLSIASGNEGLFIGGKLSESTDNPLHCTIRNLTVDHFLEAVQGAGTMDAQLLAYLRKGHFITTGTLSLKECTIKNHPIGSFTTKVDWDSSENKLTLGGMLQKAGQQLLQVHGYYYPEKQQDNLNISVGFNKMDLYLLNPLVTSVCSEIKGEINGNFQVTGSLNEPKLNGKATIDKGQLKINYLNTLYQVTGEIKANQNVLYINQLYLQDAQKGHAHLSGTIGIQNGFPLMLSGKVEQLHLLNTSQSDNIDFYGNIYASGTVQIQGPIKDVIIHMHAKTHKGTFTIITHDKENIENTTQLVRFIYNKEHKPSNQLSIKDPYQDKAAVKLILGLTILPNVKTKVLFGSYNSNDMIQGTGEGNIQLEIGTNRKPYLLGNYRFKSGTCTVSVYNLIQKTFTITPNSQVTFNGYPQEGIVDIKATYKQMAFIADPSEERNDKESVQVEISLSAYGKLVNPSIIYGIRFPLKSVNAQINTKLEECYSQALLDKNYLNKQILSLLIAKKVYDVKNINGWDALSASINDLIAQQIQNWTNIEIETDLDINAWKKNEETHPLQKTKIKVSYLFLSNHLKLSSAFGRYSNLFNDWEISYQISKAHNMSFKLYQQPIENIGEKIELFGISLSYTKQFW
ncbi:translocation/assembly module TamB domain-containing protein [Candidatus Cardinium hertigii]|nr:translocation/assembly module TamB domain-containing protein [Candidatus Cardinium hertigii]